MKKKLIKQVVAAFCVAAVLAANSINAFAATVLPAASVDFNSDRSFKINAGQYGDLFSNMKNLMPGSKASNTVIIRNNSSKSYSFYLKADSNFTRQGDDAVKEGKVVSEEGKVFDEDLLDIIDMTLTLDGKIIYQGKAAGEGDLVNADYGIPLGEIKAHSSTNLEVSINLPGAEMGNEYSGVFGAVDWKFIVEGDNSGGGGGDPDTPGGNTGGDPSPGPGVDEVTIIDSDVPLAVARPGTGDVGILIEDEGVPLAGLAKTGGPITYLGQVSVLLLVLIAGLIIIDRKKWKFKSNE